MKEFLDKTGLEYFYNKLCSVFIKKGESVKYTVSAADIQNALGYSPLSIAYFNKNITDIKNDQQFMSEQFEKLRDYAGEVGVNVDNANKSITSLASSLSEDKNSINIVKQQLDAQKGTIESLARNYNSTNAALTNVATKLDAQNGLIDNLVTRANTQGVSIAQIRQQVTDTQASIKASVSIDEVEAAIEAKVFEENGNLRSDIKLSADQITVGDIGSNVKIAGWNVTQHGFAREQDRSFDINSGCGYMYNTTLSTKNLDFESYSPPYCYLEDTFEESFSRYTGEVLVNKTILSPKEGLLMYNGRATKGNSLAGSSTISRPTLKEVLNVNPDGNIYFNGVDSKTSINHEGVTFNHSTEGEVTISWEDIYNLINN